MGAKKKEALEQFNRDNILSAARELFDEKGLHSTTMDDISKHSDYSKSTIYVYFDSKEDIYSNVLNDCIKELTDNMSKSLKSGLFDKSYKAICKDIYSFSCHYPEYFKSVTDEEYKSIYTGLISRTPIDVLVDLINMGKTEGVLDKSVNSHATAHFLWSSITGVIKLAGQQGCVRMEPKMSKREYLDYSYMLLFTSLSRTKG